MKNIRMLFRLGALAGAICFLAGHFSELRAQVAPEGTPLQPTVAPEELSPTDLLKSYLQVREQLSATQLAIATNRAEAEAAARAQAAAIAEKLESLKTAMDTERERHRAQTDRLNAERDRQQIEMYRANAERARQQAEMERSNRQVLLIAALFGGLAVLAMIVMPLLQWRTLNRMTQVGALRAPLPGGAPQGLLADEAVAASERTVASSNQRLLTMIGRMEQRIFELEHTAAPPLPAASSNPFAAPEATRRTIPISDQAARIGLLLSRGRSYLDANKNLEALACFDEILKLDLNHADALVKRGTTLERLKQDEEAIQCYNRAIKVDPKLTIAYLHKGGVCNRLQRYEEALQCYEQALRAEEDGKQSGASRSPLPGPWSTGRSASAS